MSATTYRCPQCGHETVALAGAEISHPCPNRKRGQHLVQLEQTDAGER